MRTIGVVSVGRSDWGILKPIVRRLDDDPDLDLRIIAAAAHLAPVFGHTIDEITHAGYPVAARVEMSLASDAPEAVPVSMGLGLIGFAEAYQRLGLDLLLAVGDRFEMHAAALAALPLRVPVAHVHGGEVTTGAIDDALRHSITKLSHLHFVSTEAYAARVRQLGEEPWRIVVSGAPSLDNLVGFNPLSREELAGSFGVALPEEPYLLVTFHPTTLEHDRTEWQTGALLDAISEAGFPVILTAPNADTGTHTVRAMLNGFVNRHRATQLVENLGTRAYFTVMRGAAAVVGNSSSGIVEAASFQIPVVNIGRRQEGRVRGENVVDVGCEREAVLAGIRTATDPKFRDRLRGLRNPYGDGHAAERIVEVLRSVPLDERLIIKRFVDARDQRSDWGE